MHAGACLQGFQRSFTLSVRLFFPSQFFLSAISGISVRSLDASPSCPPVWVFGSYRWKARQSRPTPPRQEVFAIWRAADSQLGRKDCLVIRVVNLPTNSSVDPILRVTGNEALPETTWSNPATWWETGAP